MRSPVRSEFFWAFFCRRRCNLIHKVKVKFLWLFLLGLWKNRQILYLKGEDDKNLLKSQWVFRICSQKNTCYVYQYMCIKCACLCLCYLVSGYISELSIFISSHIIGSQATLVHDIATCHRHLAWRFGYEAGASCRRCHVRIPFRRVPTIASHQQAPPTKHWFRKCILCVYIYIHICVCILYMWNFLIIQFFGPITAKRWASA